MFNKREMKNKTAYVDEDFVAFHVEEEDVETVVTYLVSAIVTKCLVQFEETPEIFE